MSPQPRGHTRASLTCTHQDSVQGAVALAGQGERPVQLRTHAVDLGKNPCRSPSHAVDVSAERRVESADSPAMYRSSAASQRRAWTRAWALPCASSTARSRSKTGQTPTRPRGARPCTAAACRPVRPSNRCVVVEGKGSLGSFERGKTSGAPRVGRPRARSSSASSRSSTHLCRRLGGERAPRQRAQGPGRCGPPRRRSALAKSAFGRR